MSLNPTYRDHVLACLAPVAAVRARSLFGEVALYHGEVFFGLIVDDGLYFKVDDGNRADYEAAGVAPFVAPWNPGRPSAYYAVPAPILADPEQLGVWLDKAVAAARKLKKR